MQKCGLASCIQHLTAYHACDHMHSTCGQRKQMQVNSSCYIPSDKEQQRELALDI